MGIALHIHLPASRHIRLNLMAKAEYIGERALRWAEAVIEERDVRAYRLFQGRISLTRKHPKEWGD
jgi:hypothetical protein